MYKMAISSNMRGYFLSKLVFKFFNRCMLQYWYHTTIESVHHFQYSGGSSITEPVATINQSLSLHLAVNQLKIIKVISATSNCIKYYVNGK